MNLEKFRVYADRRINKTIQSALFERVPLAAFMLGQGGSQSNLFRPGAYGILSGMTQPSFKAESLDGSVYEDVIIQTAKSRGGRTRTSRDTNPAVEQSQDQNLGSARFWWWFYSQPIKVWRSTLRLSGKGKFRIVSALTTAVDMARDEMLDVIAEKLWTGTPSTYNVPSDDDMYDDLPGVLEAMSDSNSYGNVDRSDATKFVDGRHPWASTRETDPRVASIDLIDEANDVCQVFGPGINLVLTTRAIYRKLKREALAKGGTIIHNGAIPGHGTVGYKREFIMYGDCCITFDPKCPAGYVACFTTKDWRIVTHAEDKFTTDEWDRLKQPGADDAYVSQINIGLRVICERPINQYLFTNVS